MRRFLASVLVMAMYGSVTIGLSACDSAPSHHHHEEADHHGPHGGKVLTNGHTALELAIHEAGGPPRFRAYLTHDDKPVSPSSFSLNVTLTRLGGIQEEISFKPKGDFLLSDQEVREPHSFDIGVSAVFEGKTLVWSYPSYEGRTTIPSDVATESHISTERVSSQTIQRTIRVRGKITPSEHRIAHIIPRFAGMVREGRKHIGDSVVKGEIVAIMESNQSLQPYEVRSQIAGTVINGHLIVGEFVPENQWVYVVADLSEVWADFFVPLEESSQIKVGQAVFVRGASGEAVFPGTVDYVAPYADEKAQARLVRVVLPNEKQLLVPGMFVTGDVVLGDIQAPVAVRPEALQTLFTWNVVFVKFGDVYEARPVELGLSTPEWVEVRSGLSAGSEYVTKGSFIIKADILKHGASHDH